ncbi:xanthine dehydrogenase family protein molybdopterin-binding subunit [Pseudosulfitobacter pseudonitzschiae]|uniref:xanthine dehydrogenase family protein molybdopterin-binding subunit n=1 Tax=Pseudosulfitobacter pseudonitzschiae TaxID=1402135 RepID=UPI001AF8B413|nr:xanthine dehydrogenase family protein molybdopterin-binding subunit [Pseudosulfitobacter pseudonitzschiae]MBM1815234.1 xanthine dehydrogenase family protein molybdopterin-binding subunit [Pseudosulfitobacter pseudonitzschiae]MBM1832225.1 xanthine dehydrogenase family protein molybdopterin-binding subunit [Pseudosulfitobacter pseudonitzschiae]MBM1837093.1 xanthine dehydrogenase family protein molybdopterin-binding subunit [Pseudosulfitobacter pseudonitzschiae]MBM1841939.1 xanthine dehydrogena
MDKFGKSQSTVRVEDVRFLTGAGRYVDDITPKDALHAFVLRSPVAHGTITELDVSEAKEAPGVQLVLTYDDLEAAGMNTGMQGATVDNRDKTKGAAPKRPILATGKLRYVGEPVAVIFADKYEQARDAAELIVLDYDELPAKMDLAPGGETLHAEAPDNRAFDWGMGDEDATQAAFDAAAHTVSLEIGDNRIIVNSMEPRGCYAEMEGDRIHVAINAQGVWAHKDQLAEALQVDKEQIRVTNPDVGGGFGMKAMGYPEPFVLAHATRTLNRPVRWMSDRGEAMMSDNGGRDLVSLAELAFDADHKITAYRVRTRCNLGAYNSQFGQPIQTQLFSRVLMGVYDVQTTWLQVEGYYTNTTQVDAYRGAGRPEAIYVLERVMDRAARELGIDPWELRRRNFIKPSQFPYKTATGETYDVGDFNKVLNRMVTEADDDGFAARKAADAERGLLRGRGTCYYIESILGDPSEGAKVTFNEDGTVSIYVGTQSNGQGHETVYAKFLSDQTGIPHDLIKVIQGDSDLIKQGGGTGGSRSVTTQNNATLATVDVILTSFKEFLSGEMGVEPSEIKFDDERFRAEGSNLTPTMLEVAALAREVERDDLLKHEARASLPARSFPNGAHVAEVVIDPETGVTTVDRYTVVDDFGNLINPMLAEGQVHGGVAQGIGQAITEHVVYDEDGQLLSASFMDYAMPRAYDVPWIGFTSEPVPSTANIMGMKGCGEAGTVGALAAVANAVQDALWERGVRQADMPFTPMRVWEMLKNEPVAAE